MEAYCFRERFLIKVDSILVRLEGLGSAAFIGLYGGFD
jgi:hypothetical protein